MGAAGTTKISVVGMREIPRGGVRAVVQNEGVRREVAAVGTMDAGKTRTRFA